MRAQTLLKAGFTGLVSVIPPDGELTPTSTVKPQDKGKAPGRHGDAGWYGYAWDKEYGEALAGEIDETGANIGLRAVAFPGLDIDSESEEVTDIAMALAFEHLGKAPIRLSREPRALLMYRTAEPFKKQALVVTDPDGVSHTIEMLAQGQQYVIYGDHPSGSKYRWKEMWQPFKLSAVTGDSVRSFLEAAAEHFQSLGYATEVAGGGKAAKAEPVPDAIVAGGRNNMLASIAGTLRQRNLSKAAALVALKEENQEKCEPPLDDEEVERIIESVWRYDAGPAYEAPVAAEDEFEADPTVEVPEAVEKPAPFTITEVSEMAAESDEAMLWLVDGMIPLRGSSLFAAKPKVGKSTMARSLAAAVATGEPWLGYEVQQGPVLYFRFPGEGTTQEARQEWRRLGATGVYDVEVVDPMEIKQHLPGLVAQYQPVLIVIDTLQHLLQAKDLSDYSRVHEALGPLHALARGAHVMALHHSPKGETGDMADAFLGSTMLFAAVDVGLYLRRDQEHAGIRYLEGRGRGIDIEPHVVKMDADTHVPYLAGTARQFELDELESRILGTLAEYQPDPLLQKDLLEMVPGRSLSIKNALKSLEAAGVIERERNREKNGAPYEYRLKEEFDADQEQ